MIDLPTGISIAALILSTVSLAISWYFGFRDRFKLVATSEFFPENEYGPAYIRIKVVNVGRRLVILRLLGGDHSEGGWSGTYLEKVEAVYI